MKEFKSPWKVVVITSLVNLLGNVGLWVGAVAYRYSHPDSAETVNTMMSFMYAGYALLGANVIGIVVALCRALCWRKWRWVVIAFIMLPLIAYEAVLIWMFYGIAFMTP